MSWWKRTSSGERASAGPGIGTPGAPGAGQRGAPGPRALPPLELLGTTRSGREVRGFRAPAAELVPWWHELRTQHATTGLWPVLLGPDVGDVVSAFWDHDGYDDALELDRATRATTADAAAARAARMDPDDDEDPDEVDDAPPRRLKPERARFTVADTDGLVALVPAEHGWQVPAVLGWIGGCNDDVDVVEHVVTLRDWHARFGAELVSLSDDQVLELLVARPPTTPDDALAVAREHYAYCPDVVDQGVGSLTVLAEGQVASPSWYFWWD
ncbi:DUF4253 domain-containing protein [Cellulomonas cellasea]|uniref:DUF4253 domain-containing protein n=1 Tax=Cellulomonas cellasea TaxID=43670 RepID=A0A7W4YAA2_9CELL|nr:DUF4253 domain-containing protein [Cellulomonas cellasea]MBB2922418.1 hypothetical protein [Cellulomonas cellasea]